MSRKQTTASQSRTTAFSAFEHLHIGIVHFVLTESKHKHSTEECHAILEHMGYTVGQKSAERMTYSKSRFGEDHLDVIKFLCKDFWIDWFGKQIDHLRTNHRGTYVLADENFVLLTKMSTSTPTETLNLMKPYLAFPCGLIRGALSNLGIEAFVTAEIQPDEEKELPNNVVFRIQEK